MSEYCQDHTGTCERLARIENNAIHLTKEVEGMSEKQDLILTKIDVVADQAKTWAITISTVGTIGGVVMFVIQNWTLIKSWL